EAARPDVPVLMITAYGDADTRRKALDGGAEALLTKPIDFLALRGEIDSRVAGAGADARGGAFPIFTSYAGPVSRFRPRWVLMATTVPEVMARGWSHGHCRSEHSQRGCDGLPRLGATQHQR